MKTKLLIICIFVIFALPIPIAMLGGMICFIWFISSCMTMSSAAEFIMSFIGTIIGFGYIFSYVYSLFRTVKRKKLSVQSFFPLIHCIAAAVFLLLLEPIGNHIEETREYFGFRKYDFTLLEEQDTHGGFLGDGEYYLILDCSENPKKATECLNGWLELPMNDELELIMYGGEADGTKYSYNFAENAKMPYVENGYYRFEDRARDAEDNTDTSRLTERYSFNFSVAVYDADSDIMYYYEIDT